MPNVGNDELNEARDTALELQLSNRFARVKGSFHIVAPYNFVSHRRQIREQTRKRCGSKRREQCLRSSVYSLQRTSSSP